MDTIMRSLRGQEPEGDKITAFTLLAESSTPTAFLKVLTDRMRSADKHERLPYWCLIDSLLKTGRPEMREELVRQLPGWVQAYIPWTVREHVGYYLSIVQSWADAQVLSATEMAAIQSNLRHSLISLARSSSKALKEREIRERLHEAGIKEAAENQTTGQAERLLIPDDIVNADDDEEEEEEEGEESEEEDCSGDEDDDTNGGETAEDDGAEGEAKTRTKMKKKKKKKKKVGASEEGSVEGGAGGGAAAAAPLKALCKVVHTSGCEGTGGVDGLPGIVAPLYDLAKMCDQTGTRFHESTDISKHKDRLYHLRTSDDNVQRSRTFYKRSAQWVALTSTEYGYHAVRNRADLFDDDAGSASPEDGVATGARYGRVTPTPSGPEFSRRKRKREPDMVKDTDASKDHLCIVCHESFSRVAVEGDWFLQDCVQVTTPNPLKVWEKIRAYVHTDCQPDLHHI